MIATGTPDELKGSTANAQLPDPTLEDAFIALLHRWDDKTREAA
jgi:ABC-2 type transport system ATP-binding protein